MKDNSERLLEGLDENQRQALGDLSRLAHFLESDVIPDPGKEEHTRLLAALEPFVPVSAVPQPRTLRNWLRLAVGQFFLFESAFWMAGILILLIGLFLTANDGRELLPLAFVLLAPLLAAAGVAYAFQPETRTLGELERLTATSSFELLFLRLVLVLAFNLLISLLLLLLIYLEGPQVALWRLALVWLGPMLLLTGLALYTTIRWGSLVGIILPLGLWGCISLLGWREALLRAVAGMTPAAWLLTEIGRSDLVLMGSILACLAGLGLLLLAGRTVASRGKSWT